MENELPEGWVIAKLGDIASPGGTWNPNANDAGEFLYIDIEAVDNTAQRIVAPKRLRIANAPSRARMAIRAGDVIFSLVRPYLRNIAIIPPELDGQVASTAYCVMRPEMGITSSYIFYAVLRESFIDSIKTYGNSPPSAHDDEFFAMDIPVAPANEQHRIVAAIEQQFSRLDAAITSLQHARAKMKRQRAAILKAAVEGTLTADWRAQHPASETAEQLLQRILHKRRANWEAEQLAKMQARGVTPKDDKWKDAYKEPEPPDMTNLPELPEGWVWASLNQCSRRITDGTHLPPPFTDKGIPFIFVTHIVKGSISFENTKFISNSTYEQLNTRCPVEYGDILYSAVGSYGVAVPVLIHQPFSFQRHIAHIKPSYSLSMKYLVYCLNSSWCLDQAHKVARGVAQKTVTLTDLSQFIIPLPPLAEQQQIVSEVEARLSIITQTELEVEANLKRAGRLRQTILAEAFAGRLVPQDPDNEPASVLLERIRRERMERDGMQKKGKAGNGRARAAVKVPNEAVKIDVEGMEQVELWESVGG